MRGCQQNTLHVALCCRALLVCCRQQNTLDLALFYQAGKLLQPGQCWLKHPEHEGYVASR